MIHHISLAVSNPPHVAEILSKMLGGSAHRFSIIPGAYMVFTGDEAGTTIEVYPVETELIPGEEDAPVSFQQTQCIASYSATHAAISIKLSESEVLAIAEKEGWRSRRFRRGTFDVIEFWIENRVMLEFLTPEMAADYLKIHCR